LGVGGVMSAFYGWASLNTNTTHARRWVLAHWKSALILPSMDILPFKPLLFQEPIQR
jgi:hypothetical protein